MSKFLVILIFLGWSAGSTWYYTCELKGLCEPTEKQVEKVKPPPKTTTKKKLDFPVGFQLNQSEPSFGPGWDMIADSLFSFSSIDRRTINIIGKYFKDEVAPKGFRNMGLARANAMKEKLAAKIDPSKLTTSSELVNGDSKYWNDCVNFEYEIEDNSQAKVVESNTGLIVYFPSGSADALLSNSLVNKLDRISKELAAADGGAIIIGHTDNQGDAKSNYTLGLKRAQMVRDLFIEKGVKPDNLAANSMGQTQPAGDNNTEAGRAENRRIEITFNDNK